ncbi:MarR family winged helix-turn-helix transcriptional regulator [Streptomyces sp. ODS28]|uniref:MarR family winged helix-turn-helix transcriptional regulator n=1 Tax=Streptomyces sp. ODS28 TaxID=3136688 RepID=UPI0031E6A02D
MGSRDDAALEVVLSLHRLLRALRRGGPAGQLPPTQLIVLAQLLELGPVRVGALAERTQCSQPTATAAVAELASAGLVERTADPLDGRATRVSLTEKGRRTLRAEARSEAAALLDRLGSLSPEEAERVLGIGPVLRQLADGRAESVGGEDAGEDGGTESGPAQEADGSPGAPGDAAAAVTARPGSGLE